MARKKAAKKSAKKGKKAASGRTVRRSSAKKRLSVTSKKRGTPNRGKAPTAASKKTASKKLAAKAGKKNPSPKKPAAKKTAPKGTATSSPTPAGGMYGEGNWKADEEYREGLKEFSETHDAEHLAREAADEMEDEESSTPKPGGEPEDDSEW